MHDIDHRRSVVVLCMLYKIRCNPMHSLHDAPPGPHVPVQITRGALVAHRYTLRELPALIFRNLVHFKQIYV